MNKTAPRAVEEDVRRLFRILKLLGTVAVLGFGTGAGASPRQVYKREQQVLQRQDDLRRRERMRDAAALTR